ncbi:PSMC3 interacting protein [Coemansia sp. RSA 1722]|nr:PSMC3 interacting protein [Coemansia sp. RSA 486]KAJ2237673.1 PSMC3 interacting protein [Coemansia sp. RSA 485]KAJ2600455.1 PSMC3 interacting protein [Coemansia sp. RSA 1721]KAJ2605692.1 PSMC3 interacting protein [Coemansia sp. RSA 1722]KAJ2638983.1 PSMC3 interacting protein [Coemansia sp. RSA 1286]
MPCCTSVVKLVFDYLVKTNRPYSANDISSQLHNQVTVAAAKKILNDLADEGRISRKNNNKQQIFYPLQAEIEVPNVEEAEEEEETIKEMESRLTKLKDENKALSSKLHSLTNALTDDQMRERIAKLTLEVNENDQRLKQLRAGEVISPQEKKKIDTEHAAMIKHWATRKRIFKNVSDTIAEGYPKKIKDLFDEIGIETDEDAGADTSILAAR